MEKREYLTKADLEILKFLSEKDYFVMGLVDGSGLPHKTVKYHIEELKKFKILNIIEEGRKKKVFILPKRKNFVLEILETFR